MAYNANQHQKFALRTTNWMRQIWQLLQESESLDQIYTEETASGTHGSWVDVGDYTTTELTDAVTFMRSYKALIDGGAAISQTDRTSNITPFLASE